ncbi:DUF6293 family protein [Halarchaeum sp. P4]|uniref:DUF6293 family protein n=1 Tax=Halarchaeum sp. P4 TaxID=3421639 RepID=UPI003EB6DF1F
MASQGFFRDITKTVLHPALDALSLLVREIDRSIHVDAGDVDVLGFANAVEPLVADSYLAIESVGRRKQVSLTETGEAQHRGRLPRCVPSLRVSGL